MAREIKFRGKVKYPEKGYTLFRNLKEGEWVCGDLHLNAATPHIHTSRLETYPIDPETVGQYTGLHGKNGVEIYEGDIVRWVRRGVHIEGRGVRDFVDNCEVYWDEKKHAFSMRYKISSGGGASGLLNFEDDRVEEIYYEVIGNVYDNPELVTEK